jgi:hypothetical protein
LARVQNSFQKATLTLLDGENQNASAPPGLWPAAKYLTAGLDFKPIPGVETMI